MNTPISAGVLLNKLGARSAICVQHLENILKSHNPFNEEKGILTVDRVHLNDAGNQFVAEQMLKILEE